MANSEGPLVITDEVLYGDIPYDHEDESRCECFDDDDECAFCHKRQLEWEDSESEDIPF